MINRVKIVIINNKVILENISFLGILQISNLIIFFLITPILFRVLGKENYGLVVFAQTIALFFSIIVNYGFNATATRDISVYRDENEKRSEIISYVLILKVSFFAVSLIILTALLFIIPLFRNHLLLFYFSMLACFSEALFPIWYFQGIEKMNYITYINVGTRITSALAILIFIKAPSYYYFVPLLLGIGTITGSIIGLFVLFKLHHNRFIFLPKLFLLEKTRENFPVFVSNLSSQIYVNANKIIIGALIGAKELATYDVADKIVNLLKVPLYVIGQTLFPVISRTRNISYINRSMLLVFLLYISVIVGVYFLAPYLVILMTGSLNEEIILLLRILSISMIPVSLSLFYTELRLIPFEYYNAFAKVRLLSLFIYVAIVLTLLIFDWCTIISLSWTILFIETVVVIAAYLFCSRYKLCR